MRITAAEVQIVEIPFPPAGDGTGIMPTTWNTIEIALIRLEDEHGNVGWGEGFGYFTTAATKAIIDRLIFPRLVGSEITDIRQWNHDLQIELHLHGRYGVTIFALSGVDMALWDLAAKREQVPLNLLVQHDPIRTSGMRCYASLMRYGREDLVEAAVEDALGRGYSALKLHETRLVDIHAARRASGLEVPMSLDVNCRWSSEFVTTHREEIQSLRPSWLEEPLFPPEDMAGLAALRSPEIPLAAGENWSTSTQFVAGVNAVDIWQPSITKVGGVSEYLSILELAEAHRKTVIPHCPYFGPGLFATAQLASTFNVMDDIEILFADPEAWVAPLTDLHHDDAVFATTRPGIGFEPDPAILAKYRTA